MSRGWRYQELAVDDSNAVLQIGEVGVAGVLWGFSLFCL